MEEENSEKMIKVIIQHCHIVCSHFEEQSESFQVITTTTLYEIQRKLTD